MRRRCVTSQLVSVCLAVLAATVPASASDRVSVPPRDAGRFGLLPIGLWGANGLPVCPSAGAQSGVRAVPTLNGGCILVWRDQRAGNTDIYAQRLDRSGAALWAANGVPIAALPGNEDGPAVAGDGSGGAYVAWIQRAGSAGDTVRVTRVTASGTIAPGWPADGRKVFHRAGESVSEFGIVLDSFGGLALEIRTPQYFVGAIYCQRLDSSGVPLPGWPEGCATLVSGVNFGAYDYTEVYGLGLLPGADGTVFMGFIRDRHVCHHGCFNPVAACLTIVAPGGATGQTVTYTSQQVPYGLGGDGLGGAIFAVRDEGSLARWVRMRPNGSVPWTRVVGPVAASAPPATIVPRGSGDVFLAWGSQESSGPVIRAMRVDSTGATVGGWPAEGRLLRGAVGPIGGIASLPDGAGGALVFWEDRRSGSTDLYAQWLEAGGGVQPGWPADGAGICVAPGNETGVTGTLTDDGAIVLAWIDARATPAAVYAQRLEAAMPTPTITLRGRVVHLEPGRVDLRWDGNAPVGTSLRVERSGDGATWAVLGVPVVAGDALTYSDDGVATAARYGYRIAGDAASDLESTSEVWVDVPAHDSGLDLRLAPNPASDVVRVTFEAARAGAVRLGLLDVAGRWRARLDVELQGPGRFTRELPIRGMEPGLYWVVLDRPEGRATRRMGVVR